MNISATALTVVTALALSTAPIASASARDWDHGNHGWNNHGGHYDHGYRHDGIGLGGALALALAPFAVLNALTAPPAPVVYAPPAYGYAYAYPRHRVVVRSYGYPAPVYYAAPPAYYARY